MKTITFYVVALLCLVATKMNAQSFSDRAGDISNNIERITKRQKDSLKIEVDAVNLQLEKNEITAAEADARKKEYAEKRAKNIEDQVSVEEQKLADLVKDKVDGNIKDSTQKITIRWGGNRKNIKKDVLKYRRTTSQFVYAIGVNRALTDGKADDSYKWRSDFYEVGVSWNTRLAKNNNLLHAKYGLSLQYNNLRAADDKIFAVDGNKTILVDAGRNIDVARLRYVNLVVPAHLEFDFTKKKTEGDKTYFPTHKSFRVGLGGYAGVNVKEKQIVKYTNADGNDVKDKTKGDYNVSDFVYGVSAYVSYGEIGLYAKYDLQPIFANNDIDQNNLSLGIRFDFN
ncbi:hypothetical protein [Flavobacterium psychrotrophum]|uniref:hypothetical protein n=1 Tax=Flavobacterium psychrotrophum TaxID=2294119 RepID=UPI000E323779|nr:hypothetical protein [Flavobacterium psychrotrophum]